VSWLAAVALLAVAGLASGCQSLTGRPVGQWVDDRSLTTRVKARLAATGLSSLTRVHVDTYQGTVYLTGGVDGPAVKEEVEQVARSVAGTRLVVNNLHVLGDETADRQSPAASPATEPPAARPVAGASDPATGLPAPLVRLEPESGTPGWTRYGGYDAQARRIATVVAVSRMDVREHGIAEIPTGGRVDRISVYPEPGGARYFVVLWHAPYERVRARP
jgi:hypothetical protein